MGEKNRWSHFSWTDFDWIHLLIQLILKPSQTPLSPRCRVPQSACTLIPPSLSSLLGLSSVFRLPFPVLLPSDVLRKASPPAPCPLSAPTTHKASPVPLVGGRGEDGDKDSKASFSVFELQRFGAIALLETSDCRSRMWLQVINVIFSTPTDLFFPKVLRSLCSGYTFRPSLGLFSSQPCILVRV